MNTKSYRDELLKDLQDPFEAAEYLNAALEDNSEEMFLMALRDVAEARGMVKLTEQFTSNHEDIDTILSEKNTPKLYELLKRMGLKLAVEVEVPLEYESA
ncbi:MAG TPA: transcriptional regulator [bacterium]